MAKTKVYKNETKIPQVYYDRHRNPIYLRPGESYTEDVTDLIDVNALVAGEVARRRAESDLEEGRRVKRALAMVRTSKTIEELDRLRADEKNPDVIEAIQIREKELSDDAGRAKGKA